MFLRGYKPKPDIPSVLDDLRPMRTAIEAAAAAVHSTMSEERSRVHLYGGDPINLADLRAVRDRTGAIWYLREQAMEKREEERAAYVKKYRPIQTLDGLDPHPSRTPLLDEEFLTYMLSFLRGLRSPW